MKKKYNSKEIKQLQKGLKKELKKELYSMLKELESIRNDIRKFCASTQKSFGENIISERTKKAFGI